MTTVYLIEDSNAKVEIKIIAKKKLRLKLL